MRIQNTLSGPSAEVSTCLRAEATITLLLCARHTGLEVRAEVAKEDMVCSSGLEGSKLGCFDEITKDKQDCFAAR